MSIGNTSVRNIKTRTKSIIDRSTAITMRKLMKGRIEHNTTHDLGESNSHQF